jgi:GAF domain-containing protein
VREATEVLADIRKALEGAQDRSAKFRRVAEIIRDAAGYRWVGLYDVTPEEIAIVMWSGPGEPAHPRFPVSKGICGEAVRRRKTVVVGDVTKDARYLTTFGTTRAEIVVPILDSVTGRPRGLIDVESDRAEAFGDSDRELLERCAAELATAMSPSPG